VSVAFGIALQKWALVNATRR